MQHKFSLNQIQQYQITYINFKSIVPLNPLESKNKFYYIQLHSYQLKNSKDILEDSNSGFCFFLA